MRSALMAGGFAIAIGVTPASAQMTQLIEFTTTFPFSVGRATLPAGSYTVRPALDSEAGLMQIRGQNGAAMFFGESSETPRLDPKRTEVLFDHSGDRFVLKEIWDESSQAGVEPVPARHPDAEPAASHQAKAR